MTSLRMEDADLRARLTVFFFAGEGYWEIAWSIISKRFVLMMIQAFFYTWMVTMPISAAAGVLLQVSVSLPWWCLAESTAKGVFIALLTMPIVMIHLICGSIIAAKGMGHFLRLLRQAHMRRSAEELLRGGLITAGGMLPACGVMLLCSLAETFVFMNIA